MLQQAELVQIDRNAKLALGAMTASFFQTNHSIPDCLGVVFDTPEGKVVYTWDFKFDLTPVHKQTPDLHKMAAIGQSGVLVLLSESTNAERPGFTPSEKLVGDHLREAFALAILRDRKHLSEDGILVVTRNKTDGKIISGPDLISRGFVYGPDSDGLIDEATWIAAAAIEDLQDESITQWNRLKQALRESIGRYLYAKTKRRPMILPIIMDV